MRAEGAYRPEPWSAKGEAASAAHRKAMEGRAKEKAKLAAAPEQVFSAEHFEDASFNAEMDSILDTKLQEFKNDPHAGDVLRQMTWRRKLEDELIAAEIQKFIASDEELDAAAMQAIKQDVQKRMAEADIAAKGGEIAHEGPEKYNAGNYRAS